MKAPRVTPLEGVYTYARRHTWARSREPAGFRHDERRFITLSPEIISFHQFFEVNVIISLEAHAATRPKGGAVYEIKNRKMNAPSRASVVGAKALIPIFKL